MAKTISEIYSNFLTENFIKRELKNGVIPTPEEIEANIKQIAKDTSNFAEPLFNEEEYLIEEEKQSSAASINNTFGLLHSDLSVLYKALIDQGKQSSKIFDSSFARLKGFEKRIEDLSEDVESLLFESQYSDRYEDLFYEKFKTNNHINEDLSSIDHDRKTKTIKLKADFSGIIDYEIKSSDLTVKLPNETGVISSAAINNMSPLNIFSEQNTIWQHQVVTSKDFPIMMLDLIVRLGDSSKQINSISIDPADASNRTQISCEISTSVDGLNWSNPDGEWRKRMIGETDFSFKGISPQFIKFRFIKTGTDAAFKQSYTYNFGIKNIKFIGSSFNIQKRIKEGTFYSKVITPKKNSLINKIGIMTCHVKPEGSGIQYALIPLTENQISNFNNGISSISDFTYYNIDIEKSQEQLTFDSKSLLESEQNINNIPLEDAIDYKFKDSSNSSLNQDTSSYLKSETIVLRREGNNETFITQGKETFLANAPFGWLDEGEFYTTIVRVTQYGGAKLQLGQTKMIVDGNETSGEVTLSIGFHRIKVFKRNWFSVDLTSIDENSPNPDVLYPFNHKYLIEGLSETLYGIDLDADQGGWTYREKIDPESLYQEQMSHWAIRMKELEEFEFHSQKTALDTFCYKLDNNGIERIIVSTPNKNDLLLNERFSIITKAQSSDPIKGVILKASLSTEDETVTPLICEYLIRIK